MGQLMLQLLCLGGVVRLLSVVRVRRAVQGLLRWWVVQSVRRQGGGVLLGSSSRWMGRSDGWGCYSWRWVVLREVGLEVLVVLLVKVVGSVASVSEGFRGRGSAVSLMQGWVRIRTGRWVHGRV